MVKNEELVRCTRCFRERRARFMIERKNFNGKLRWRCRKKSVCHSTAKRVNPQYRAAVTGHKKATP